ncbi:hypothetical protein F7725_000384 [Dissostichus mawsoni]|uniref:Uncharacterized protein n=1 Tax=Dissostichus mawsoni TaxID=36200 RepID=A0A7J5ZGL6_DISMA|nr:hypothetical protein F7725_000384 [Dissostichus mawsoni]
MNCLPPFSLTVSKLRSSVLDVHGPFSLLNALRCIRPGEAHTLVLAFSPSLEKKFCETLEVRCQKMTLEMTLRGEGVLPLSPALTLEVSWTLAMCWRRRAPRTS